MTVYGITSLPFELARPARLADRLHGHRAIEALHQLRDVTFCEDASQVGTGAGPSVMVTLQPGQRVLCRVGPVNVAATLRRHVTPPRSRPTPTPRHPRNQIWMKPTSRQNDGALP